MKLPGNFFGLVRTVQLLHCEMWCLILWMSKNRVRKMMFGPKREEVTEDWRRLHNEELHGLYYLSNVSWMIK
jgi:hypothetical protein